MQTEPFDLNNVLCTYASNTRR